MARGQAGGDRGLLNDFNHSGPEQETLVLAQASESPGCEHNAAGGKGTLHRCPGSGLETKARDALWLGVTGGMWAVGRGPSIVLKAT